MPTAEATNPLSGTVEDFTAAHWKEFVDDRHTGGGDNFSKKGGEAVLTGWIDNTRLRGCYRYCLGYQHTGVSAPYWLRRTPPIAHPRWTHLRCTAATGTPFKPDGTSAGGTPAHTHAGLKRYVASPSGYPTFEGYSGYTKAEVSLRFEPLPYTLTNRLGTVSSYSGGGYSFPAEWERWTTVSVEPRVESLSLDGFQLVYAEGSGAPAPYSNPTAANPKTFPAPYAQLLVKPDVVVTTHELPEDFLFTLDTFLPRNVMLALGRVNRLTWNGYPAGTLLLLAAKLTRDPWPHALSAETYFNYTMELHFSYFNPTKGYSGSTPTQITTNLGHNNMPWRGTMTSGDLNAGKWFYATRTGNVNDPALLETFDVAQCWRSVKDAVNL